MPRITTLMSDMNKIENGIWVNFEGVELCVASINNPKYKQFRSQLLKPHLQKIRSKAVNLEDVLDIIKPAAAKHLLLGWKNLQDENGQDIPYSYEKAMEFFSNPALSDLYNFVLETAGENATYRQEVSAESEKN